MVKIKYEGLNQAMNRILRYFLIGLISCLILSLFTTPVASQFPIPTASKADTSTTYRTPWWDPTKARQCGRLLCSKVNLIGGFRSFEVAAEFPLGEERSQVAMTVEQRAIRVQRVQNNIFQAVRDKVAQGQQEAPIPHNIFAPIPPDTQFSDLISAKLGWFPQTPLVEVGTKNNQTVIFVPEQPELGLTSQTIVTVNEADRLNSGQPIPELAQEWRMNLRHSFSEALWRNELDRRFPWIFNLILIAIIIIFLIPILFIASIRHLLKKWNKRLKHQLHEIKESLTSISEESEQISQDTLDKKDTPTPVLSNETPTDSSSTPQNQFLRLLMQVWTQILSIRERFVTSFKSLGERFPRVSLQSQTIIEQERNFVQLFLSLFFWLQVCLIFAALALIFFFYPQFRSYSEFFLGQAIYLPLIWMGVAIADKLSDFLIDYFLNRWAEEGQEDNPSSNRYTLRVGTYSSALKGATTFLFTIIGILLTVTLIGFDPSLLASVGGIAFVIAFLSRNVMEDMLNGALILWTDRYAIGDVIQVGPVSGLVEDMNIYTTQLRGGGGRLTTLPNSQIKVVENFTKDWSRAEFEIRIAYDADVRKALVIIEEESAKMQQEEEWGDYILEPALILGADDITHEGILLKVWIKTMPGKHFAVTREFRLRIKDAFELAGIALGIPHRTIENLQE